MSGAQSLPELMIIRKVFQKMYGEDTDFADVRLSTFREMEEDRMFTLRNGQMRNMNR